MSEDSFSDGSYNEYAHLEDSNIEIKIQTLMARQFTLKVSLRDTIGDIKRRISRIEGIPIYQQNLLHKYHELKDTYRLCDVGITNGSTLTLVPVVRGGPISTRRLSVTCEHHVALKELKDLLDNQTRDEMSSGSKVSVLVFKEGDVINLLRVIENEDGSYSPYSRSSANSSDSHRDGKAGTSSPSPKPPVLRENRTGLFERLAEDNEMLTKMNELRKKMDTLILRRKELVTKDDKIPSANSCAESTSNANNTSISYKLLSQCNDMLDTNDLKICEKHFEEENEEEIALKDKHRSKLIKLPARTAEPKTIYRDSKGVHSHTKHMYTRANRASWIAENMRLLIETPLQEYASSSTNSCPSTSVQLPSLSKSNVSSEFSDYPTNLSNFSSRLSDLSTKMTDRIRAARANFSAEVADFSSARADFSTNMTDFSATTGPRSEVAEKVISPSIAEQFAIFKEDDYVKPSSISVPSGNRIHLTRLVLSDTKERPKSSPNTIELEENAQDIWEIHQPSERLKHSATCSKFGVLKRPQSLEFSYDDIENHHRHTSHHPNTDLGNYSCSKNSEFEVCSGNFYHHMPQFVTTPSGGGGRGRITPKSPAGLCDYYFSKPPDRSPLYGRSSTAGDDVAIATSTAKTCNLQHHRASEKKYASTAATGRNSTGSVASGGGSSSNSSSINSGCSITRGRPVANASSTSDCSASSIQRLRNDESGVVVGSATTTECDNLFSVHDQSIDELYGYYNLGCSVTSRSSSSSSVNKNSTVQDTVTASANSSSSTPSRKGGSNESDTDKTTVEKGSATSSKKQKMDEKPPELPPPVIKKKARCSECNKRLNITNIYDCRCGKMFCSQHRYPEVHKCTYDYKLEGRKILKQQNPLVTAEKVAKI